MTEQELYDAFVARLRTVDGLPSILQTENTRIILQGETPYLRATMLYAEPAQLTIGATGKDLHQGIFQVDVFVPTDTGTTAANAMVTNIIASFPRGLRLGPGDEQAIISKAYRSTALRLNDQFHHVPISIQWKVARAASS